jgi:hypothetical protein
MNSYKKYCPNVFVAKCEEEQSKGETAILTTKYGQEHENEIHNFLGKTNDGFFLYSITRLDGFNAQERAKKKAEKLEGYATNANNRSAEAFKKSDGSEAATGIPFGQPILVGHHSERKHRKVIEGLWRNMDKSIEESNKAEAYANRADYWNKKAKDINLSMPESLDFYEFSLEEAKKKHKFLRDNPKARAHAYSLTYANKEVKELTIKVNTAIQLWGDLEEIELLKKEKEEKARANATKGAKGKKIDSLINQYGGFFFFGANSKDFKEKYNKLIDTGKIEEGEKVTHLFAGLFIPVKHKDKFL